MTELVLDGATPRQQEFIKSLLKERNYEVGAVTINSPKEASNLIRRILLAPKKPLQQVDSELFEALSSVQKSKYAVPTSELFLELFDEVINNDLLFLEVKERDNNLQIRRLHGAVGSFSRTELSRGDSLKILKVIAQDPYKYAKMFGEHYSCCGKCSAELTDEKSRKYLLGPDCRKAFGIL